MTSISESHPPHMYYKLLVDFMQSLRIVTTHVSGAAKVTTCGPRKKITEPPETK